jgi:hypothetical protein
LRRSLLLSLAVVSVASGCAGNRPTLHVNERRGTIADVRIGNGLGAMLRNFGDKRPADHSEPASPLSVEIGDYEGPSYFKLGPPFYRYDRVTFFVERGRIVGFMAVGDVETASGIASDDDLDHVTDVYPHARCGEAPRGEYDHYPACAVQLSPQRFVWFGGDPISTIMVGIRKLDGVS